MNELKDKLRSIAKEYARQVGELIGWQPQYWVSEDISMRVCCFGETEFFSLSEMQAIIDHMDKWVARYGNREAVASEIRDWLEWKIVCEDDVEDGEVEHTQCITLYHWLEGVRQQKCAKAIEEVFQHKSRLRLLRQLANIYGDNRSIGNVVDNIQARMKNLEKKLSDRKEAGV